MGSSADEPPPMQPCCFYRLKSLPEIGRKYRPIYRFQANVPVANPLKTNLRLLCCLHGMEEVVGSIPTRSTIPSNYLGSCTRQPAGTIRAQLQAAPASLQESFAPPCAEPCVWP